MTTTTRATPLSEAEIVRIQIFHQPQFFPALTTCFACEYSWPCETSRILATLDARTQERDDAQAEWAAAEERLAELEGGQG